MSPHILVVDDDKLICTLLTDFIRRMGYTSSAARNGEDALRILKNPDTPPINLVITDFWMPAMSGIELLQAIHDRYPDLPVIIISGAATKESAIAAVNAGAFKYLEKPYERNELTEAIESGLHRYSENLTTRDLVKNYAELERRATDQLRVSRQLQAYPEGNLERLIHGLNHELGNVTQAIQMNLSVLAETNQGGGQIIDVREHLDDLRLSVDELVELLAKLREYPHKGLQPESLPLGTTLAPVIDAARNRAQKNRVILNISVPEMEVCIFGAALELRKAFGHVMENAFEAVEEKDGGQIDLSIGVEDETAVITVNDNGSGFNRDVLEQPFSPGKTGKLREGFVRGLSLGLFITRALIDIQNGSIYLANRPDGGATVVIRLPLAPEEKSNDSDPMLPAMYMTGVK